MRNIRALTLFTVFCFLVNQASFAVPGEGLTVIPQQEGPAFLQIEIPENLASVEEIYQAPPKSDPQLILYIQNAHGSYEAQMKIKQLLDYLYQSYGFKLIFVEGAAEKLDPGYLRLFPDAENNKRLADYLAKQGELTGAEFYLMDGPADVEAVGIEKAEIYRANYEAFKTVYRAKAEGDAFTDGLDQKMQTLASRLFSSDARRLLSEWKKFESGHRDFLPYVRQLAEESKKVLGVDLESLFSQVEWPQITRLLVLQSMEKDLNRVEAEKERVRLLAFLEKEAVSPALIKDILSLGEKRISMNRLSDSGKPAEERQPRYLMERLIDEAGPKGFQFHDYPAFSLYAGYLILQSELESRKLFEEIGLLFKKILDELTPSELEKNLLELYRDQDLLRKLFHLELTRGEWGRVYYRREWIEPKAMNRRLAAVREDMESDRRFRADQKDKGIRQMTDEEKIPAEKMAPLEKIFESAFRFYDFARQREAVFRDVMRKEMAERKTNKAVLITGGFHTEGVSDLLREEEVNYGVLMPKITQAIDNVNYLTTMMEDRKTIFDYSNLEAVIQLQDLATQNGQGSAVADKIVDILAAYVGVAEFKNRADFEKAVAYLNQVPFAQALKMDFSIMKNEVVIKVDGQEFARIPLNSEGTAFMDHVKGFNPEVLKKAAERVLGPKKLDVVMPEMPPDLRRIVTPPTADAAEEIVPPAAPLVPAVFEEQFGNVRVGATVSESIANMGPEVDSHIAVMALTGGIAAEGTGAVILNAVAEASQRGGVPDGYGAVREQLAKISPVFANPETPGVLGVELDGKVDLAEFKDFAQKQAAILTLQFNQSITMFAPAGTANINDLNQIIRELQTLKDVKGEAIGDRFSIKELKPGQTARQVQKTIQSAANGMAKKAGLKRSQAALIQQNAVLIFQSGSDLVNIESISNRVEGLSSPQKLMAVLQSVVGIRFSQLGNYEEVNKETVAVLKDHDRRYFEMLAEGLKQWGAAEAVAVLLEATFKIASSA